MTFTETIPEIMIVDDNPNNLRVLTSILEESGYVIRPALDGRSALMSVRSSPPDLILLDIMMPGMDGYEVCDALKADDKTQDIPVIFLSALDDVSDKVFALQKGGIDYITKPFQVEEVLLRIQTHLKIYRQMREIEFLHNQERQQRKQIEDSEQKYRDLFENAHDLIQSVDGDGRFVYVNRRWRESLGYTAEEVKTLTFPDIIHPDHLTSSTKLFETLKSSRQTLDDYRVVFITKDKREIMVEGNLNAELVETGEFRMRGIFRDVTARNQAQAHALQTMLENEKLRILSDFIRDTSHDLRTPLSSIQLQADLLARMVDDERIRARANNITDQVQQLSAVLDQFHYYVMLVNHMQPDMKNLQIHEIVEQIPANFGVLQHEKRITLAVYSGDGETSVYGDLPLLQTAFHQLLHNALIYTPEEGQIEITYGLADDKYYFIEVRDTGVGISSDDVPRVFNLFYKVNTARTSDGSGAGVGLTLVKRITEIHNGYLEIDSTVGKGTSIRVMLQREPHPTSASASIGLNGT